LDITAYIRELLFGHDCVIVPGFGGFIGNYTPARIDKNSNTFFPPVKQISFNRNLNHNDGLLVGRISGSAKMNYADARNLVEEFVNDIRKRLSKGEKVVFGNIGSFINNHEGNVQFEPDRDANYHLDSYGLTSFQVTPLEGYDVRKKVLKYKDKEPVKQASARKIMWRAAVVIPLLTALVVVSLTTDILKTKVQSTNMNPLANIEFENNRQAVDSNRSSDSLLHIGQTTLSGTIVPEEPVVTIKEEEVLPAQQPEMVYCLIAGSFKSEDNASGLIKKLESEGYKPELMKGPNGFYRVSVTRCSSLAEASDTKDSIGKNYPGTWVARIR
jgi:nucleoid DNA-binding protein/cell division protein FtsL